MISTPFIRRPLLCSLFVHQWGILNSSLMPQPSGYILSISLAATLFILKEVVLEPFGLEDRDKLSQPVTHLSTSAWQATEGRDPWYSARRSMRHGISSELVMTVCSRQNCFRAAPSHRSKCFQRKTGVTSGKLQHRMNKIRACIGLRTGEAKSCMHGSLKAAACEMV